MVIKNLMSGGGFEGGAYAAEWFSAWISVSIVAVIVFLCYMFIVKHQMSPYPFSFTFALVGILLQIVSITLGLPVKIAFIIGIVGVFGLGFGIPRFMQ